MSAAVLAVVFVPILIRWAHTLANRPTDVKDKFRPSAPLRALYPSGIIIGCWGLAFEAGNVLRSGGKPNPWDVLGGLVFAVFLAMTILSWPIVVEVSEEGLTWHRLLIRRYVNWREVEDVNTDMGGGLVIYLSGDRRINVGQYTEGRTELKAFIAEHIKDRAGL